MTMPLARWTRLTASLAFVAIVVSGFTPPLRVLGAELRRDRAEALRVQAGSRTVVAQTPSKKKLLFLTYAGLYKHASLAPAEKAVTELGASGGFDVTTLEGYKFDADKIDLSAITPDYLAGFDGLMLMTNGNLPFTPEQKKSIVDFVRDGKALVGVHCASLTMYDYPEFGAVLGGYYRSSRIRMV